MRKIDLGENRAVHEFRARLDELVKSRKLGHEISAACEWNGFEIMAVFAAALEDANFHRRAEQVEGWYSEDRCIECATCGPDMLTAEEVAAGKVCELCALDAR